MNFDLEPIDLYCAERLLIKHPNSPKEGLATLIAAARQGHVAVDLTTLSPAIQEAILSLPATLVSESQTPVYRNGNYFYLQKNWIYESKFLEHVKRLSSPLPSVSLPLLPEKLNAQQQQAVYNALSYSLSVITGGPGTGKTYTAAQIVVSCLEQIPAAQKADFRIILAAPTGKAAAHLEKNILKLTGPLPHLHSSTLHALLGYRVDRGPKANTVVLADLILVDECSMIDAALFSHCLSSIAAGARVVLIGDKDQLPPVETGSFFADLSEAGRIPSVCLQQSLRVERQSLLKLADAIKMGQTESAMAQLYTPSESIVPVELKESKSELLSYISTYFPLPTADEPDPSVLFASATRFQILCCMRQGPYGVDAINEWVYRQCMKGAKAEDWLPIPILVTKNDYHLHLYNGDTGFLIQHRSGNYALFLDKEGQIRRLAQHLLPAFEYAYCLSVHKSQGSEYDEILLVAPEGSESFGREVLYTAITRARRKMSFYAPRNVMEQALAASSRKHSGILYRNLS